MHVVDRSHPRWDEQKKVAEEVMSSLGVETERILTVFNKSDRVDPGEPRLAGEIHVSALSGEGLDDLREAIADAPRPAAGLPAAARRPVARGSAHRIESLLPVGL